MSEIDDRKADPATARQSLMELMKAHEDRIRAEGYAAGVEAERKRFVEIVNESPDWPSGWHAKAQIIQRINTPDANANGTEEER